MSEAENTTTFHLGREFSLKTGKPQKKSIEYEARDLTTHGVVVGMTGSGKTGLSITLLEEVARNGIPSVIIDLKGDLSNLLLNFPELKPEEFAKWVDPDEARRRNLSVEKLAEEQARAWKDGLKESGVPPGRIQELRDAAYWRIYTPGSEAGIPVSVVQTFAAPPEGTEREVLNQKVEATTTALMGLADIPGDSVHSREHILISNLLLNAWTHGRDLDLERLIGEVTEPPLRKIGTFDTDMFYPEEERLKLALALNNLLASPSFAAWVEGEPLDMRHMMYAEDGTPRQSIFYLAHLDDSQRMFFLTLLLEEMIAWMRTQQGTGGLRAVLYIDEMFGYLPPHPANPPSKRPLMTLLKQARAFGVGILLATQNPVDLDYKALSNAGTWFVGKLQTERDKDRLLEGLTGAIAEQGATTNAKELDEAISKLSTRTFLLHNIHRGEPVTFQTRWAMSYLYGPMTRDHIAELMADRKEELGHTKRVSYAARSCPECDSAAPSAARYCMYCGTELPNAAPVPPPPGNGEPEMFGDTPLGHVPPILPPGLDEFFLEPDEGSAPEVPEGGRRAMVYEPRLMGFAEVMFSSRKPKLEYRHSYRLATVPPDEVDPETWDEAFEVTAEVDSEPDETHPEALWAAVPEHVNDPKKLKELEKEFVEFLVSNASRDVLANTPLGLVSAQDEDEDAFRQRCRNEAVRQGEEHSRSATNSAQAEKMRAAWTKKVGEIKEVFLTPKKSDIKVTHFGIVWAPFWWVEGDDGETERVPAFEYAEIPAGTWRGDMPNRVGAE